MYIIIIFIIILIIHLASEDHLEIKKDLIMLYFYFCVYHESSLSYCTEQYWGGVLVMMTKGAMMGTIQWVSWETHWISGQDLERRWGNGKLFFFFFGGKDTDINPISVTGEKAMGYY